MFNTAKALTLATALLMAPLAQAQTTTAPAAPAPATGTTTTPPAPAAPAATAAPASNVGQSYVKSTSGDWDVRCVHAADGKDPCDLYQLLKDEKGNSVARFSLFGLKAGQPAAARATVVTPLETLLPQGVSLQIDTAPAKEYAFLFCTQAGCVSQLGFTADEIAAMKKGQKITMKIVPVAQPDAPVVLTISLKGFTAGYDDVNKANGN
jgi:invasion protein IalB